MEPVVWGYIQLVFMLIGFGVVAILIPFWIIDRLWNWISERRKRNRGEQAGGKHRKNSEEGGEGETVGSAAWDDRTVVLPKIGRKKGVDSGA